MSARISLRISAHLSGVTQKSRNNQAEARNIFCNQGRTSPAKLSVIAQAIFFEKNFFLK
jgi:hypothetical protein